MATGSAGPQIFQDRLSGEYYYWLPTGNCYVSPRSGRRIYVLQANARPVPPFGPVSTSMAASPSIVFPNRTPSSRPYAPAGAEMPRYTGLGNEYGGIPADRAPFGGTSQVTSQVGSANTGMSRRDNVPFWEPPRRVPESVPKPSDLGLSGQDITTHKRISPGSVQSSRVDPRYQKNPKPQDFFRLGKVFGVLWAEPAGSQRDDHTDVSSSKHQGSYVKVRRFVVIRPAEGYCSCSPIVTYQYQGVAKRGVKKSEHAIIYSTTQPPLPKPDELPQRGEEPMQVTPVRVMVEDRREKLDPMSRIHFGKVYTVEHNIKVRSIGVVEKHGIPPLVDQFQSVWMRSISPQVSLESATSNERLRTNETGEYYQLSTRADVSPDSNSRYHPSKSQPPAVMTAPPPSTRTNLQSLRENQGHALPRPAYHNPDRYPPRSTGLRNQSYVATHQSENDSEEEEEDSDDENDTDSE